MSTLRVRKILPASFFFILLISYVVPLREHSFAAGELIVLKNSGLIRTGDALILELPLLQKNVSSLTIGKTPVQTFSYRQKIMAVFPIAGRESAGVRRIELVTVSGQKSSLDITVAARPVKIITLPVPPSMGVTPQVLVANLATQKTAIQGTVSKSSNDILISKPFGLPLADNRRITSPYGEIRKTGNESIRHLGVDFGGKTGSLVYAINDGVILDAYVDPVYGKTIIVDHGAHISSLYMHLDSFIQRKGANIKQGDVLGTLGQSGLASAPHLHLSIKINGESVDPLSFIRNFK